MVAGNSSEIEGMETLWEHNQNCDKLPGEQVVHLKTTTGSAWRSLTKGCPQGSAIGPDLWNVFFESLLNRNVGRRNEIIAYADDALVVVRGNTRHEVERGLKLVLEELTELSQDTKMEQSQTKTVVMTLQERIPNRGRRGGARDANRKFVARCDDMRVELARGVRFLGVYI